METTYPDSWSEMSQPCDMDLWVMKGRSALSCILQSSDFALYLEDYLMYVHYSFGV